MTDRDAIWDGVRWALSDFMDAHERCAVTRRDRFAMAVLASTFDEEPDVNRVREAVRRAYEIADEMERQR